jgi:acetyl-CoA carboxylase biotin carboxylase subunit
LRRVLIANRGEIAVRVGRTCKALGIETVAVASEADQAAAHVRCATASVVLGPASADESYLDVEKVLAAAKATGADAIHPGYGFLSENAGFARAVAEAGLLWIGPSPEAIETMGDKQTARTIMATAGVPVVPGAELDGSATGAASAAKALGYPVLVKASAGGGGKGMRAVHTPDALDEAIAGCRREAASAFGDDTVYLEKLLERPRHVEVQIFGDAHGNVVHLFDRECSIQRRHQKVVEESPSPGVDAALRQSMCEAAVAAARAVDYVGAGTVEFLVDPDGSFYFLEMNTRLQVEHAVTEAVLGLDLVALQIAVARGEALPFEQDDVAVRGHAIEVRLYAEDPQRDFLPSTGTLIRYRPPEGPGVRHDGGFAEGDEVSPYYDPMLAKLITWGVDRQAAMGRMAAALETWTVHGVVTNLGLLRRIVSHEAFCAGETHTGFIEEHLADGEPLGDPPVEAILAALAVAEVLGIGARAAGPNGRSGPVDPAPFTTLGPWRGVS